MNDGWDADMSPVGWINCSKACVLACSWKLFHLVYVISHVGIILFHLSCLVCHKDIIEVINLS